MNKRADAIFHDAYGKPLMVIECKRQEVQIDDKTIAQIAMYNRSLDAPYLLLTNGDATHVLKIDTANNSIDRLQNIPRIDEL
jgi:type I site-specific restriction endonuclease